MRIMVSLVLLLSLNFVIAEISRGSVVRIAPNEFSISDMDIMREVYGPRTTFEKVSSYPSDIEHL